MDDTDFNWVKSICDKGGMEMFDADEMAVFSKEVYRKLKAGMYLERARVDVFNYHIIRHESEDKRS